MPKIISRSQAFQSANDDDSQFLVYYCICGAHVLIAGGFILRFVMK